MATTASSFKFFDAAKSAPQPTEAITRAAATIIGQDVLIKGNMKSSGDITIAGIFEGDIACEGRVTIAPGATLVGGIAAAEIVLAGKHQGNSVATKALSLLSSAEVRGDITTPQIVIEPGATFVGRCSMPQAA
jgi:cytoskeletal protein CcmA (bactofilin family)